MGDARPRGNIWKPSSDLDHVDQYLQQDRWRLPAMRSPPAGQLPLSYVLTHGNGPRVLRKARAVITLAVVALAVIGFQVYHCRRYSHHPADVARFQAPPGGIGRQGLGDEVDAGSGGEGGGAKFLVEEGGGASETLMLRAPGGAGVVQRSEEQEEPTAGGVRVSEAADGGGEADAAGGKAVGGAEREEPTAGGPSEPTWGDAHAKEVGDKEGGNKMGGDEERGDKEGGGRKREEEVMDIRIKELPGTQMERKGQKGEAKGEGEGEGAGATDQKESGAAGTTESEGVTSGSSETKPLPAREADGSQDEEGTRKAGGGEEEAGAKGGREEGSPGGASEGEAGGKQRPQGEDQEGEGQREGKSDELDKRSSGGAGVGDEGRDSHADARQPKQQQDAGGGEISTREFSRGATGGEEAGGAAGAEKRAGGGGGGAGAGAGAGGKESELGSEEAKEGEGGGESEAAGAATGGTTGGGPSGEGAGETAVWQGAGSPPEGYSFLEPIFSASRPDRLVRLGLLNVGQEEAARWKEALPHGRILDIPVVQLADGTSPSWQDLYPEWVDESQGSCPALPMPAWPPAVARLDALVAHVPCQVADWRWARNVMRHHMLLVAAGAAAQVGTWEHI
eukprot:jgi/Mesen1/1146/ME001236S00032